MLKVIHLLVTEDQTCGVPGRFIGENMALLRDVVAFASSSGAPLAILSLDQEKAFDRVDWGFMRSTLVAMGFGPSFVAWVDLFYHRVQSSVNVNGHISGFFSLSRGVRQGCPLSPFLYVLVSEVLAANIPCNTCISGLHTPGFPPLSPISKYADDTSLIVSSDDAIKAVFETYALFERASGSKLNKAKSKGLWGAGVIAPTLQSPSSGLLVKLRFWGFLLVLEIWMLITGILILKWWTMFSNRGILVACLFVAKPWLSMLLPSLGCGMWHLWSRCPPGWQKSSLL